MARSIGFVRTPVGVAGLWGALFVGVVKITFCMSILIIVHAANAKFVVIRVITAFCYHLLQHLVLKIL